MSRGMSEKQTIVGDVWLIEEGLGEFFLPPLFPTFQCTPSYSSTIVHIERSLPLFHHHPPTTTTIPYVAPGESYAYMEPHIPHIHSNSVYDMSHSLPLVWKGAHAAASKCWLPTVITSAMGFFMVRVFFFFYGRDPPDIWHTSGAV